MMQTAAAATTAAAAAAATTCNVQLNPFVASPTRPSFSTATSAHFFQPPLLFSIVFSFLSISLSLSPSLGVWRQVGVAAAAWLEVFRFPSGRTYTVSTLPVCVNGNVAYA